MRAIIIDPTAKTVEEADIDTTYETFRHNFKSGWVERVPLPTRHWLWIDEEGLLQPEPEPFFRIPAVHLDSTFCGKGIILGEDDEYGDHAAAAVTVEVVRSLVTFPTVRFVGFEDTEGYQDHPVFGRIAVFSRKAIFEDLP